LIPFDRLCFVGNGLNFHSQEWDARSLSRVARPHRNEALQNASCSFTTIINYTPHPTFIIVYHAAFYLHHYLYTPLFSIRSPQHLVPSNSIFNDPQILHSSSLHFSLCCFIYNICIFSIGDAQVLIP
jgi:hypothetical protein